MKEIEIGLICRTWRPREHGNELLQITCGPAPDDHDRYFFKALVLESHGYRHPENKQKEVTFSCVDFDVIRHPTYGWHQLNWLEFVRYAGR